MVTELSSIKEIRDWLDFYGVTYKKSERKAQLVKRMTETREELKLDPTIQPGFELLTPELAQKTQELNQMILLIKEATVFYSDYLANALLENSMIETNNSLKLFKHPESEAEEGTEEKTEPDSEVQYSEFVLDSSILPLIDSENTATESEKEEKVSPLTVEEGDDTSETKTVVWKSIDESDDEKKENNDNRQDFDNEPDTEDYEDANDDTEDDVEIDDYKDSTPNKWKSAAAGILMVGIPAAGFLYWLVSNGIL
jgi:hypothetical protein